RGRDQGGAAHDPHALRPVRQPVASRAAGPAGGTGAAARSVEELVAALRDADPDVRVQAVLELGESNDPRAARYLIGALRDEHFAVSVTVVRALERLGDPVGVLPMYELVQDEEADLFTRHTAAEALVTLGLLRRKRVGPSRIFLWLAGMVLVLVALAAAQSIGPGGAIAVFAAGAAALIGRYVTARRKERDAGTYIGPDGGEIHLPLPDGTPAEAGFSSSAPSAS
ncbi:MAG: HEAT repeat domain-containing protein, partial [Solirubrobacterales bacterium]